MTDDPERHTVHWLDFHREPKCAPDPAYPDGVDIKAPSAGYFCKVELPYPAKCVGLWLVKCKKCGTSIGITAAGRPDDPRSVEVKCIVANLP